MFECGLWPIFQHTQQSRVWVRGYSGFTFVYHTMGLIDAQYGPDLPPADKGCSKSIISTMFISVSYWLALSVCGLPDFCRGNFNIEKVMTRDVLFFQIINYTVLIFISPVPVSCWISCMSSPTLPRQFHGAGICLAGGFFCRHSYVIGKRDFAKFPAICEGYVSAYFSMLLTITCCLSVIQGTDSSN